jgi:hypothetical protein
LRCRDENSPFMCFVYAAATRDATSARTSTSSSRRHWQDGNIAQKNKTLDDMSSIPSDFTTVSGMRSGVRPYLGFVRFHGHVREWYSWAHSAAKQSLSNEYRKHPIAAGSFENMPPPNAAPLQAIAIKHASSRLLILRDKAMAGNWGKGVVELLILQCCLEAYVRV